MVPAVGITPANVPEAVTGDIAADLDAAGLNLAELHIDRAYLASDMVRQRAPDLAIFCKAWRSSARPGGCAIPLAATPRPSSPWIHRRPDDLPGRGEHAFRARQDRALPQAHLRQPARHGGERMDEFKAGDQVVVVDAQGQQRYKRALGPVVQGGSFEVVWACRQEEWQAAHTEGRDPVGLPWPAEDVSLMDGARSA